MEGGIPDSPVAGRTRARSQAQATTPSSMSQNGETVVTPTHAAAQHAQDSGAAGIAQLSASLLCTAGSLIIAGDAHDPAQPEPLIPERLTPRRSESRSANLTTRTSTPPPPPQQREHAPNRDPLLGVPVAVLWDFLRAREAEVLNHYAQFRLIGALGLSHILPEDRNHAEELRTALMPVYAAEAAEAGSLLISPDLVDGKLPEPSATPMHEPAEPDNHAPERETSRSHGSEPDAAQPLEEAEPSSRAGAERQSSSAGGRDSGAAGAQPGTAGALTQNQHKPQRKCRNKRKKTSQPVAALTINVAPPSSEVPSSSQARLTGETPSSSLAGSPTPSHTIPGEDGCATAHSDLPTQFSGLGT